MLRLGDLGLGLDSDFVLVDGDLALGCFVATSSMMISYYNVQKVKKKVNYPFYSIVPNAVFTPCEWWW